MQSALNKVADFKACDFIKKRSQSRCFLVNIAKFLRTPMVVAHKYMLIINTICSAYLQGYTVFRISCSRVTFVSLNTFFLTKAFLKIFLLDLVDIVFWLKKSKSLLYFRVPFLKFSVNPLVNF